MPDLGALLVVDVQDRLLAKVPAAAALVRDVGFLLDVAGLLGVPVRATEQYPKGLGPTNSGVARRLPAPPAAKTRFSAADAVTDVGPGPVTVAGVETHVCVAQTAADLLAIGRRVVVPVDAVAARFAADHDVALRRLERLGAELTTVEAVAFGWLGDVAHPQFKAVSKLVVDRAAALAGG